MHCQGNPPWTSQGLKRSTRASRPDGGKRRAPVITIVSGPRLLSASPCSALSRSSRVQVRASESSSAL
eukprot:1701458-Pyramimonas_sp.AAC.1